MNRTKRGRFGVLFLTLAFLIGVMPASEVFAATSWLGITETVPAGAKVISRAC